jgi:hypothetical protein
MRGTNRTQSVSLPRVEPNAGWKLAGSGDFNGDGWWDVLWRNELGGQNMVWLMSKSASVAGSVAIQSEPDLNRQIAGTGDFNHDGKIDIMWHDRKTGQKSVWLMDGTNYVSSDLVRAQANPDVVACAVGDFDGDGNPDIVVRHIADGPGYTSGEVAIWLMNSLTIREGLILPGRQPDLDWQVVGTGDFNRDGHIDILWRHATIGLNLVYFMNRSKFLRQDLLLPSLFDTDWRMAGQDTADSSWRLSTIPSFNHFRPSSASGSEITLSWVYPKAPPQTYTLQRRRFSDPDNAWLTVATNLTAATYTDTSVTPGERYHYRVHTPFNNPYNEGVPIFTVASAAGVPIENRGRLVLLVDNTVAGPLAGSLAQLTKDLIGDGWSVIRHDVPRHNDANWTANPPLIQAIKSRIISDYNTAPVETKSVYIIGHVPIPYSGYTGRDFHARYQMPPDHQGAWPTDIYYGDIDGNWDESTNDAVHVNFSFEENSNRQFDGKFPLDHVPGSLELSVGRIDFARLPTFTDRPPRRTEVELLQQYLDKCHRYRHGELPIKLAERTIAYGTWLWARPNNVQDERDVKLFWSAIRATGASFPDEPGRLCVGDPYLQSSKSYLWGFLSGNGYADVINRDIPLVQHTTADLKAMSSPPPVAFFVLMGSYLGDWNMTDNLMRATLALPTYPLVSLWTRSDEWRFDRLGVGEHIGASPLPYPWPHRDLTILGDPTLRVHVLEPPSGLVGTPVPEGTKLTWAAAPGVKYYVYSSANPAGPFTRVTPAPITEGSFADKGPAGQTYLVRALQLVTSGCGTYTNISQGAFWPNP